jgi:hypothetical protein
MAQHESPVKDNFYAVYWEVLMNLSWRYRGITTKEVSASNGFLFALPAPG